MEQNKLRHEWKHEISYFDLLALRPRLRAVMQQDAHAKSGYYQIRSLYFDNLQNKALQEKLDGVNFREKFRLRYYNGDTQYLLLEKKSKLNGLCGKEQVQIDRREAEAILRGDSQVMLESNKPLLQELACKMVYQGLRPRTIVDYTREPFVYGPGNVRVTLDYNIRTGIDNVDFLNPGSLTVPVADSPIILEVKWDEYLPDLVRDAVQVKGCRTQAFSKYAACRGYE